MTYKTKMKLREEKRNGNADLRMRTNEVVKEMLEFVATERVNVRAVLS